MDRLVVGSGRLAQRMARATGAARVDEAEVWGAFAANEVAVLRNGTSEVLSPRELLLAPESYALPWPIPGWGRPGVYTIDTVPTGQGRLLLAGQRPPGGWWRTAITARRAGWQVRRVHGEPIRCDGDPNFTALLVRSGGRLRRIPGNACVLHGGYAPEVTLARALGAAHHMRAEGVLETITGPGGTTTLPNLRVLTATAGNPVPANAAAFADTDIVCPCERATAGAVRAALAGGALSWPAVKRATRAGMGTCQGRRCAPTLHAFCGAAAHEARHIAPRAPLRPVRIGAIMRPHPFAPDPLADPPLTTRWSTVPPGQPPPACDTLVIGGGVVGLTAARELARAGRDVLVLDRGEPALGASTANAGTLHVQLVPYVFDDADPGPLGEALALGPASIALWRELATEAGETLGIRTEGGLILAATGADLAWLQRKAAFERARGIDTQILGPSELAAVAPALTRTVAGAAFCADEGQMDPLRGTATLLRLARQAGVQLCAGTPVTALEPDGTRWQVRTPGGTIRARHVLNAAGAYAGVIARMAGIVLRVRAVVQQVIATAPVPPTLRQVVAQARQPLSLKQTDGGQFLLGGSWPGRLDPDGATRLLRSSIEGNLWTAAQAMPGLFDMQMLRAWTGLTVHLDGPPVISATPGHPGLFHAVTTNGYTLGPLAGRMIAETMLGHGQPPTAFGLT